MIFDFFQNIHIFGLHVLTFIILFLAFEAGVYLGKRHQLMYKEKDKSPVGSIVAATLGLLAFLLAFTFGMAATKFDERRMLVIDESNAIGTTYLRSEYLPDPYRIQIKKLLKDYVFVHAGPLTPETIALRIKNSENLQDQIWQQAVEVVEKNPNSVAIGLFIQSLNQMIDLAATRVNIGMRVRIPFIVWIALYFVTILALGTVGYQIGLIQGRYIGITLLLILTFSSVIVLIVDLDRPQEGFIKISQQSLIDLMEKFNRN